MISPSILALVLLTRTFSVPLFLKLMLKDRRLRPFLFASTIPLQLIKLVRISNRSTPFPIRYFLQYLYPVILHNLLRTQFRLAISIVIKSLVMRYSIVGILTGRPSEGNTFNRAPENLSPFRATDLLVVLFLGWATVYCL
jgi:hypothetical protein